MKLTLPQLYMYNHAAWYNGQRSEKSAARKREQAQRDQSKKRTQDEKDPIINGKRLSEMTTNEYLAYWGKE